LNNKATTTFAVSLLHIVLMAMSKELSKKPAWR